MHQYVTGIRPRQCGNRHPFFTRRAVPGRAARPDIHGRQRESPRPLCRFPSSIRCPNHAPHRSRHRRYRAPGARDTLAGEMKFAQVTQEVNRFLHALIYIFFLTQPERYSARRTGACRMRWAIACEARRSRGRWRMPPTASATARHAAFVGTIRVVTATAAAIAHP